MTDLDLTKLREIAEAATQWTEQVFITSGFSKMDLDARHIASFDPPTVLALIDEIERLRAQVDAVAERAWDQAVGSIRYEDGSPVEIVSVTNPYRIKAGDGDA